MIELTLKLPLASLWSLCHVLGKTRSTTISLVTGVKDILHRHHGSSSPSETTGKHGSFTAAKQGHEREDF